jgi:hypothetical protein
LVLREVAIFLFWRQKLKPSRNNHVKKKGGGCKVAGFEELGRQTGSGHKGHFEGTHITTGDDC